MRVALPNWADFWSGRRGLVNMAYDEKSEYSQLVGLTEIRSIHIFIF